MANSSSRDKFVIPNPDSLSLEPPMTLIVIGMAGSGKTTFTQRLFSCLNAKNKCPFVMNLDPAVLDVPYAVDVDIRDTISYKDVMEEYQLGPNGAIMTCLNLFTAQFDEPLESLAHSGQSLALVDTPGQIEIFTWSASGTIITEALASIGPTALVYIMDVTRCTSPTTFMSNMLYACSILYKAKLPFILVLNKVDETPSQFILDWMEDFETFQSALHSGEHDDEASFMTSLVHSMSLVLEEFYRSLTAVKVSSLTGEGMDDFLEAVDKARLEYETDYKPELEKKRQEKQSNMPNMMHRLKLK